MNLSSVTRKALLTKDIDCFDTTLCLRKEADSLFNNAHMPYDALSHRVPCDSPTAPEENCYADARPAFSHTLFLAAVVWAVVG